MIDVYAELVQRREALEKGHWVNHTPRYQGEMCLGWDLAGIAISQPTQLFLHECLWEEGFDGLVIWNDTRTTKEEVLAFLDRAIGKAKKKETD